MPRAKKKNVVGAAQQAMEVEDRQKKEQERKNALSQISAEVHKPIRKKYPRRKVTAPFLDAVWSMDLVDMQEWGDENDGHKYMLNVVDVFSRYAFSRPMKDKTAKTTFAAFLDIIKESNRSPKSLWVDQGKEFYNNLFKKWLADNQASMYSTFGEHKSCIVERFNRTLKTLMWKRFTSENTHFWLVMLPELIVAYNTKKHSFLNMTPAQASMAINKKKIEALNDVGLEVPKIDPRISKFKLNDTVRISKVKGIFEKGYLPNWSSEQFTIASIIRVNDVTQPLTYKLKDYNGETLEGSFYEPELQKVSEQLKNAFFVEEILKTKTVKGKREFYIRWHGWPSKFDSWEPESSLQS